MLGSNVPGRDDGKFKAPATAARVDGSGNREKTAMVEVAVSAVLNELRDHKPRSGTRQKAPGGILLPSFLPPGNCPVNINVSLSNLNLQSLRTIFILQKDKCHEQRYIQVVCRVHTTFHLSSIAILIKGTENLFFLNFDNFFYPKHG